MTVAVPGGLPQHSGAVDAPRRAWRPMAAASTYARAPRRYLDGDALRCVQDDGPA
ncbi:hypothetical protein [Stenotrophomonas mori]|uniref:hypothetical protein n=1 Tax=Stenotrophomonas mori TaxID=2871096 RepID=UPI00202162D9|nr:hypothetical protein [Stenotrophomonas mori]